MPDRLPVAHRRSALVSIGVGLALSVAALLATLALAPLQRVAPFALLVIAVAVSAALGGALPAAVTALAGAALAVAVPVQTAHAPGWDDVVRLGAFLGVSGVLAFLGERTVAGTRRERARREWCEVTLRSIGDGVIVTDAAGHVRSMNLVAEALTGWRSSEAVGRALDVVLRIVNGETGEPLAEPLLRIRPDGVTSTLPKNALLVRPDGSARAIDDNGAPIWSEDGEVAGAVLVFRDVSDQRAAERETFVLLERERMARSEAEAANRAKDEFLATLSHELRTPLNAMLGWTQLLRQGPCGESETRHGLEVIDRNVRRLARLIDDVLDVSRIVAGKLRLELSSISVSHLIRGAVDDVRREADAKSIRIETSAETRARVLGDPDRLQQVLWNLLSNAIKFSPKGGTVRLTTEEDDAFVEIEVQDEGVGVSPSFLPFLFDPFRQEDATVRRTHGGLGLGLAIVRHLVEMHGGTVDARSAGDGCGSSFTIRLPRQRATEDEAKTLDGLPATHERSSLAGLRVLAVDDDPDARDLLERLLSRAGASVEIAASADDALARIPRFRPNVIVSDLEMPEQDGFALIRRVREAGFVDLPAVALTAYAGAEHRRRALVAGFQLHVPKPLGPHELAIVVAAAARWRPGT